MITRYAELIFDISIISHLFVGWRLATHHEGGHRLSFGRALVKRVGELGRHQER